ncbi:MAG TPA: EAL domain-containing protein [Burkholderiaceae bacterium]|nr:EAL domain-containing protein [Burkholderiaceae bacterium]
MASHPSHSPPTFLQLMVTVVLGAIVIAGLTTLSGWASTNELPLTLYWPAAGIGFAMLCTQGKPAAWALGLGVGLWSAIHFPQNLGMVPFAMAATVAGQWWVWRKLQVRFAGTSQPFARQTTMLAFLRAQGLVGAPLSAGIAVTGAWLLGQVTDIAQAAYIWGALWIMELCGTVLFAPLAWELLISRTRSGLPRFFSKVWEALQTDWQTVASVAAITCLAGALWLLGQPVLARAALLLMLPVLAFDATRAGPLTIHIITLLAGVAVLSTAALTLPAGAPGMSHDRELVWLSLAVLVGVAAVQVLLVTAHERRLALKRLERQADTDPLTNLLSVTGLYRKLEELNDRADDPGETQISVYAQDTPMLSRRALVSVQMTNADSIEQLLGSRKSDVLERATSGALTAIAPRVLWSRISKAHFVGLVNESGEDLDQLLSKVNFAVVEAKNLVNENIGRPLWTLAAVTLDVDPLPPVEIVMACLRKAEQIAQDSRHSHIMAVNQESGSALKQEAEQAERIRQVIQRKQLVLFAQPIVANTDPESLKHKYEVLIRLRDDDGTIVPPDLWMPIAMRAGMMQSLDMAVMEETFEWFASHPAALEALSHCAINLSGPTVASPVIAQRIAEGLAEHKLPAHKFTFEITESQAIANPAQATETIRAIRACGCRVAIDDFGTGVATFDYLKRFDVDYIKIDGQFIKSLLDDPVDRVIVESIVKVAHQMNVRTVAEFVGSMELYGAVKALGVDESQGFAFGKPKPLHEWFGEPA